MIHTHAYTTNHHHTTLTHIHTHVRTRVGGLMGCQRLKKLWLFQNKISAIEGLHAVRSSARLTHTLPDTTYAYDSHHSIPLYLYTSIPLYLYTPTRHSSL